MTVLVQKSDQNVTTFAFSLLSYMLQVLSSQLIGAVLWTTW